MKDYKLKQRNLRASCEFMFFSRFFFFSAVCHNVSVAEITESEKENVVV
jgi:hypothetical protein